MIRLAHGAESITLQTARLGEGPIVADPVGPCARETAILPAPTPDNPPDAQGRLRITGATMRAAVTGGAGFIGHHLVAGLLARGDEVNVIDDFSTGWRSRLVPFGDRVTLTQGSVLDPSALDVALAGCEVVFHEAAIASVARSLLEPRVTNDVNANGTIEVMLAAARHGVRRVVFAGSSAVYGIPESLPCTENQRPAPISPYGASKLAAEHYLHSLGQLHGIETSVLRYFNVYGPGQDPAAEYAAVIPQFITAVIEGRRPTINGSGDISRDFVYIDDVVEANLLAARASSPSGLTFNIASGSQTSLRELLQVICHAANRDVEPVVGAPRPGDILHSYADVALARRELGYGPVVSLSDGIAKALRSFRASGERMH
jgi:UDP-glucose 4-epimerase